MSNYQKMIDSLRLSCIFGRSRHGYLAKHDSCSESILRFMAVTNGLSSNYRQLFNYRTLSAHNPGMNIPQCWPYL